MCLEQNLENRMSQDMSLGVQNRTSDFDRKNRPPNSIKNPNKLHYHDRIKINFLALLSDRKMESG